MGTPDGESWHLHLADDTFIAAAPERIAPWVADPGLGGRCWPDLQLRVSRDRGVRGRLWALTGDRAGSVEIWLEPVLDGTVVHLFLRLAAPPGGGGSRAAHREGARRTLAWKAQVTALKDELEAGRQPGTAALGVRSAPGQAPAR